MRPVRTEVKEVNETPDVAQVSTEYPYSTGYTSTEMIFSTTETPEDEENDDGGLDNRIESIVTADPTIPATTTTTTTTTTTPGPTTELVVILGGFSSQ